MEVCAVAVKIKDNRKKFDELQKTLANIHKHKPTVAVGVLGKEGSEVYPDGEGVTVVDIATFNEFGTPTIPARSFLRHTFDVEQGRMLALLRKLKSRMARGEIGVRKVLTYVGEYAQKQVNIAIVAGGHPFKPNAPSTIAEKGSSSPLINTGRLRQSIRYEVRNVD
jgi:hypothetical protein